jgi:hypothetical protein
MEESGQLHALDPGGISHCYTIIRGRKGPQSLWGLGGKVKLFHITGIKKEPVACDKYQGFRHLNKGVK